MTHRSVTINFTGGIISPGYLKDILQLAKQHGVASVRFGLRQQLILDVRTALLEAFIQACKTANVIACQSKEALPNIVSAYPAAGIFTADSWLREGVYKDIFDLFHYYPRLKINICDSQQCFVPFFTGHINWISSPSQHFWHLYIRFPKTARLFKWKDRVYTNDIPRVSQLIEHEILEHRDLFYGNESANGDDLYRRIKSALMYISTEAAMDTLSDFSLPYYEGFNKADNQLWLGIYRRDELFPINFLMDACQLCLKTRIGQLYTTPWKSIIIKNIDAVHRKSWDIILGRYRINVRHAANELNWQVEDYASTGMRLKMKIIRHFDIKDVRTYGLCFAVQTRPASVMFGSVVIRKRQTKNPHRLKALERYDILYRKNFNPNAGELILFRDGVEKDHIAAYLVSLCKFFYEQKSNDDFPENTSPEPEKIAVPVSRELHQCTHCHTVYDPVIGDELAGISAGTDFDHLPGGYHCPLCGAGNEEFKAIMETSLFQQ